MLKTKLPTWSREITDEAKGVITTTDKNIDVYINTSVLAEERWEALFPHNAKTETLFAYISRILEHKQIDGVHLTSTLKALFCFIESDEISDFKAFCRLFDFSDSERLKKLVDKIKYVFDLVLGSSASNSKN